MYNEADHRPLRVGFLSTATIAKKNWRAIRYAPGVQLVAVASRSVEKAQAFIDACSRDVPLSSPVEPVGGYEKLLARKDIDAVYIPLPTALRFPWILAAADAGKHILCEKPIATSAQDTAAIERAVRAAGVQFMDGTMFPHSLRLAALGELIHDRQELGDIRYISSAFSFATDESFWNSNIRGDYDLEPLGCLGDLGWYCVYFMLWVHRWALPTAVCGISDCGRGEDPSQIESRQIPAEFTATLQFDGGSSAQFHCSFRSEHQQFVHVVGQEKSLRMDDFVLPFNGSNSDFHLCGAHFAIEGCEFVMEPRFQRVSVASRSQGHASAQESRLWSDFAKAVAGGVDHSWLERSVAVQSTLNRLLNASQGRSAAK